MKVVVFFGGRSEEHWVSVQSARSVFQNLDSSKYEIFLVGIDKSGDWYHVTDEPLFLEFAQNLGFDKIGKPVTLISNDGFPQLIYLDPVSKFSKVDIAFPVLHGPYGEDGSFQGLLKCHNLPFIGSDVLASALAMDKVLTKKLLLASGFPVARFVEVSVFEKSVHYYQKKQVLEQITALGFPVFVKPANMGSSIGIQKVKDCEFLKQAIENALQYDKKAIVEEAIKGRELEICVLGNEDPQVSLPGEIIPHHDFYSYEAKYLDPKGAELKTSGLQLSEATVKKMQSMAKEFFLLLGCKGMARIDFFLKNNEELLVNEVNTIPGFTAISMYPKLWKVSGLPYPALLDRLIHLALKSKSKV